MDRKKLKHQVFMAMAKALSKLSTCSRLQVGAVIVSQDNRILSTGYNGRPSGVVHCIEDNIEGDSNFCLCTHAEQNAIASMDGTNREPKSVYVTAFPCDNCLKLLAVSNVKNIYYADPYRYFDSSIQIARKFGMTFEKIG